MTAVPTESQGPSTALKVLGVCLVAGGAVAWFLILAMFAFGVPRFEEIFSNFDVEAGLPALTQALIAVSHFEKAWWHVLLFAGLLLLAVLVYANLACRSRAGICAAAVFARLSLAAAIITPVLVVIGMFLPLVHLTETIGGGR